MISCLSLSRPVLVEDMPGIWETPTAQDIWGSVSVCPCLTHSLEVISHGELKSGFQGGSPGAGLYIGCCCPYPKQGPGGSRDINPLFNTPQLAILHRQKIQCLLLVYFFLIFQKLCVCVCVMCVLGAGLKANSGGIPLGPSIVFETGLLLDLLLS